MPKASADFLSLVAELNMRRLRMVLNAIGRRSIGEPNIPPQIVQRMMLCRQMHKRFLADNYQSSQDEWDQIKSLCNWLVREHDRCQNRTPRTEDLDMPNGTAFSRPVPKPGLYRGLCRGIKDGSIRFS